MSCWNLIRLVTNILCDGGYTGDKFAKKVNETTGSDVETAKKPSFINLLSLRNVGLWNELSVGQKNVIAYGKTVNENLILVFIWLL